MADNPIFAVAAKAQALRAQGANVITLAAGEPQAATSTVVVEVPPWGEVGQLITMKQPSPRDISSSQEVTRTGHFSPSHCPHDRLMVADKGSRRQGVRSALTRRHGGRGPGCGSLAGPGPHRPTARQRKSSSIPNRTSSVSGSGTVSTVSGPSTSSVSCTR